MRTILLAGKNGKVGWELQRTLLPLGRVVALGRRDLDLARPEAIRATLRAIKPDVIVNAAAYTDVNRAEQEFELAQAVNGIAPGIFAEGARALGAWLVHYSTDYVFDGEKAGAYRESDVPNPLSVYGKSKLAGEAAVQAAGGRHLIFRTGWVYGSRGKNFMLAMLRQAREGGAMRVVDDQFGAPTWCRTIAEMTAQILAQVLSPGSGLEGASGIYHMTASGCVSWHGYAAEIMRLNCMTPDLKAVSTSDYPTVARRPKNSVLSSGELMRVFGLNAGDWLEGLRLCMEEMPRAE